MACDQAPSCSASRRAPSKRLEMRFGSLGTANLRASWTRLRCAHCGQGPCAVDVPPESDRRDSPAGSPSGRRAFPKGLLALSPDQAVLIPGN